jgi:DNA-directed RNA polymerase
MTDDDYINMRELGDQRVIRAQRRASLKGTFADTKTGNKLLQRSILKVLKCFEQHVAGQPERAEIREIFAKLGTARKHMIKLISIGLRHILGDYASTRRQVPLAGKIGRAIEDEMIIERFKKNAKEEFRYRQNKMKPWKLDCKEVRVSFLKVEGIKSGFTENVFTQRERSLLGMHFIEACTLAGVVEQDKVWVRGKSYHCVVPREDVLDWIMKADEALKLRQPYWLPLSSPPVEYKSLYEGGYKSDMIRPRPCIKVKSEEHRKLLLESKMPVFFEAMNNVSRTAYRVNPVIEEALKFVWNAGGDVCCVPNLVDPPTPPSLQDDMTKEEKRKIREAHAIHKAVRARNMVDRKKIADILMVCRMFAGKDFYFCHHADARGRMYPVASTISPQGNNLQRALTMFADSRQVTGRGEYWLRVNAANHYGMDKLSFESRLEWTRKNEAMFVAIARDPIASKDFWLHADGGQKTWTFLAAAHELGSYLIAKSEGRAYHSHLPVYVDCSASGFQHLALLALDPEAAEKVNVAPTHEPKDIYTETAKALLAQLKESEDPLAKYWVDLFHRHPKAIRKLAKKVVMTVPYSVSPHAAREYVHQELDDYLKSAGEKPEFGKEVFRRTAFLSRNLMTVIRRTNKSAFIIMDFLRKIGAVMADENKTFHWFTPSGFVAYQATYCIEQSTVKYVTGGKTKFYNLGSFTPTVSKRHSMNGVVPNFIHSLDSATLQIAINKSWTLGIRGLAVIHDAVGALAEDLDIVNMAMRDAAREIYREDQLKKFSEVVLAQLDTPCTMTAPTRGSFDPELVSFSRYFLS